MNRKHHKRDAFWIAIQLLVVKKMKYICEHKQNVQSSNYWKMTHKRLYLSTALLSVLNINNHRYKIVQHNKCSDMANCSWIYNSRRVSLYKELISAACSWIGSITKEMPSESPFNCLWLKKNFRLRQPVTKILRQIDETIYWGFLSKKFKDSSIKTPIPFPYISVVGQ